MIDITKFENVTSIQVVEEMSGATMHIRMKNGSLLIVAPENDAVVFFRDEKDFLESNAYNGAMFCDMGSGHHDANTNDVGFVKSFSKP